MNIDYEKISLAAREEASNLLVSVRQVKKIIEAYEAQKKAPEWVPLDLATVKQGQEVTLKHWEATSPSWFVCAYKNFIVVEQSAGIARYVQAHENWLMRAPKPKTVRVKVYHLGGDEYVASIGGEPVAYKIVGEGDIEVTE